MDTWIGLSPMTANTGLRHRDNGVCAVDEEGAIIIAISEERLTKIKHDYRFDAALHVCLDELKRVDAKIRGIGYSTCSDSPLTAKTGLPAHIAEPSPVPSHHYSHALSAYWASPFAESLIVVADAGGNVLVEEDLAEWWAAPREQTTLWYGSDGRLSLLERYHDKPFDIGYGEWFRAFTYYLGWNSHTLSGNTMALSAQGHAEDVANFGIWDDDPSGTFGRRLYSSPRDPIGMVRALLDTIGMSHIEPREFADPIHTGHASLAAYLQASLERSLKRLVVEARAMYGQVNLCLTGGVAQNCVAAAKIAQTIGPDHLFVSGYSGDVGQCVGNALYARSLQVHGPVEGIREELFLGPEYSTDVVDRALGFGRTGIRQSMFELTSEVAERLVCGEVVGLFAGRSEFGPRALGHRSVICDPCLPQAVKRVKTAVKRRDEFMPLAPVIDARLAAALGGAPLSSSMTLAPTIPVEFRAEFGEGVHVDGTARIRVEDRDTALGLLLDAFYRQTDRRVLINTSFNQRGAPIVESPEDALLAASELGLDALLLEDRLLDRAELAKWRQRQ